MTCQINATTPLSDIPLTEDLSVCTWGVRIVDREGERKEKY